MKISPTYSKLQQFYNPIKRALDLLLSIISMVILTPFYIVISFLIFLDDGFPILFRQVRTGYCNKSFVIYKFRTMKLHQGANQEYTWNEGVPDDFMFKTGAEETNKCTCVGKFLRQWSLDELPQFFNVLQGNMSIIGPRPEIPTITKHYTALQNQRLVVKPGITGWAQVKGRSNITHGDKIKYDLEYCQRYGFIMDCKIMVLTILKVVTRIGAV